MDIKPASQSRTLRFNRLAAVVATVAAAAPSVLGAIIDALGDPQIAALVSGAIPGKYRALVLAVVAFLAKKNWSLRMETTTAIAGSPAAEAGAPGSGSV
jgi:hypothetical protein